MVSTSESRLESLERDVTGRLNRVERAMADEAAEGGRGGSEARRGGRSSQVAGKEEVANAKSGGETYHNPFFLCM